jgi:hypothetical protein
LYDADAPARSREQPIECRQEHGAPWGRQYLRDAEDCSVHNELMMKRANMHILATAIMLASPTLVGAQGQRELKVHLVQANNDSPYTLVRAKFEPGEVADPWGVRFVDDKDADIPYFVWDSVTWRVAQDGRPEWGHRYALINHAPGDAPEVVEARGKKLEWTRKTFPELAAKLDAQEAAARKAPDSVCAAIYLLRRQVPALGKDRVRLRIGEQPQVRAKRTQQKLDPDGHRVAIKQGSLEMRGLPDQLVVAWNGNVIMRSAGFHAGGWQDTFSHADPTRPFAIEILEGLITRVSITAQTKGRRGGAMDWHCTYWLFPEGGYVALEGFSIGDATDYVGGPQKLSILQSEGGFANHRAPSWDRPWWLHQASAQGFVASHLFEATPLAVGFGNNPFAVNSDAPDKSPKAIVEGNRLALTWAHRVDDPAIMRIMAPQPLPRPNNPKPAPRPVRWQPKVDWLYRQYIMGFGEQANAAETALRNVLGAAAGWIDRPISEEETAALLVKMMPRIATGRESSEIGLLKVVPAVLSGDKAAIRSALSKAKDPMARTDYYINLIRTHVARGGRPSEGKKKDDADGTPREGWTGNPCYHAALMPCYVRVCEHFDLPVPKEAYREAILRYADFSIDIVSGRDAKGVQGPLDFARLNATFQSEWPSRIVPMIPLTLHADNLKQDPKYARSAKLLFDDLHRLVERNPHGYFPVWTFRPNADRYDTVYNPVTYERGLASFWAENKLDVVGRADASRLVAAQARWFVYSGQLLDTLETDNATAIRATTHGGHTGIRNQIGIYLYDDFAFYRGLVGDLVAWSAATCQVPGDVDDSGVGAYRSLILSNAGSTMLRWALDIRPGSKWLESRVHRLADGFRLEGWNRLPFAKPDLAVGAHEVGLQGKGDVLQVRFDGPAFREAAQFTVASKGDQISFMATARAKIQLAYRAIRPDWGADDKVVIEYLRPDGRSDTVPVTRVSQSIEWQAAPGEYRLIRNRGNR